MSPLQQQLNWWFERLGWIGTTTIALLIGAIVGYGVLIIPAQKQLFQLEQRLSNEQQFAKTKQARSKAVDESESSRQRRFYNEFPHRQEIPKLLKRLYAVAKKSDLTLQRGQYKLLTEGNGPFMRYEIELPLVGRYTDIQTFSYQALKQLPTLALDDISFKREAASATLIQAKIRFTLYLLEP